MNIEISTDFYEKHLKPYLPEESSVVRLAEKSIWLHATTFELELASLDVDDLEYLYDVIKKSKSDFRRSLMMQLSPVISVMKNPEENKVTTLKALSMGIIELMKKDCIDGWLYQLEEDQIPQPYLLRHVRHLMPRDRNDRPLVEIELAANSAKNKGDKGVYRKRVFFDSDAIQGKTVREILLAEGIFKETPDLKAAYEEHVACFRLYQPQFNHQFWIQGDMFTDGNWRTSKVSFKKSKAVNEEEILDRKFTVNADASFWRSHGAPTGFDEIPFHAYISLFHLDTHQPLWCHVSNMTPYEYDTSLRDKLVLPETHRDLIDILVEDLDILQEDIIAGKSGGTTILCTGKPGLGKTLSAEVYAEVSKRPLYKVHSGQLGLKSDTVEKNLEIILKRSSRWGAVLLLDEADVYIRNRGNDLEHNAVVAAFLRTLEYFNGLLFMTTNRGDDVDDAILSRCIAIIQYETPTAENAKRIWSVLSQQLNVEMPDELIEELTEKFPNVSGRDIKELLKLTSRYAKGKALPLSLDLFRKCAQFRGVTIAE